MTTFNETINDLKEKRSLIDTIFVSLGKLGIDVDASRTPESPSTKAGTKDVSTTVLDVLKRSTDHLSTKDIVNRITENFPKMEQRKLYALTYQTLRRRQRERVVTRLHGKWAVRETRSMKRAA